jgi:hypothetical protein
MALGHHCEEAEVECLLKKVKEALGMSDLFLCDIVIQCPH